MCRQLAWVPRKDVWQSVCQLRWGHLHIAGEVKLADFGLARIFGSPDRKYTNQVTLTGKLLTGYLIAACLGHVGVTLH